MKQNLNLNKKISLIKKFQMRLMARLKIWEVRIFLKSSSPLTKKMKPLKTHFQGSLKVKNSLSRIYQTKKAPQPPNNYPKIRQVHPQISQLFRLKMKRLPTDLLKHFNRELNLHQLIWILLRIGN